ncbi:hypothetical protein E2C01_004857 [Portunus trituberculatus]|uniref:Uncharacterized protein n=1 Tax=Portunus trituberculatus TaxID=210409 RepID=A0A5B7CRN2_PORTR|nr:hypothetical protein [Portunus trituberculatus]
MNLWHLDGSKIRDATSTWYTSAGCNRLKSVIHAVAEHTTCGGAVEDPRRCVLTLIVQDRQTAARPGKNLGLLAFLEASPTPLKSNSEGACSSLNDKNEHLQTTR